MFMRNDSIHDCGRLTLLSMHQVNDPALISTLPPHLVSVYQLIAQWITSYLMSNHAELGRAGDVCPFTAHAARLDTIRIGASDAACSDNNTIKSMVRYCFEQFALIPAAPSAAQFRAIIIGFANLSSDRGIACLRIAQSQLKYDCLRRGLMLGRFEPNSTARGLCNPDFRPLRSPIPLLAIREIVENDAAFAVRHPLLIPAYLYKYPAAGLKRLLTQTIKKFWPAHVGY
jgi:hypothetical protein